ncbi:JAB-like toxin 1 domain-containing protein [Bacteroides sp. UBA939]|uniref:JAB-like toxin 1 domain-containing protein n=1 Tax=Bacteroides sp. UBA939 TaxID=1946092 RepID=UPI0025BBC79E|nr:JAB-like toxin 1 domain-containing protein [Bacteroides sp. UBA939]
MKKVLLVVLGIGLLALSVYAQKSEGNPFARLGYQADVYTFGGNKEFHDQDVVVVIGDVRYNTKTKEVVGFVTDRDTLIELRPELQSMSIDPHAEKYYSVTPYAYCMNNPVRYVDPDGRDVWEMQQDGTVKWIEESKEHTLYALNKQGERTGASITITDRTIFDQLTENRNPKDYDGSYAISDSHEVGDVFLFAANNSNVEWGLEGYQGEEGRQYVLRTQHETSSVSSRNNSKEGLTISNQFFAMHSHPGPNGTLGGSGYGALISGDRRFVRNRYYEAREKGVSPPTYYVFHKESKKIYQYNPQQSSIYIKKVTNNNGLRFIVPKR